MAWLRNKKRLTVRPGTKETITSIVDVMFRCDDAELSAEVASSIIAGYEKYIGREAELLSRDVLDKLQRFQEEYDKRAKFARDEYLRLNKSSDLIRVGEDFKDLDTESLMATRKTLGDIEGKIVEYTSAMEMAKQQMERDPKSAEMILTHLARVTNDPQLLRDDPITQKMRYDELMRTETESGRLRMERLDPLIDKQKALLGRYGEGHPQVTELTSLIESLEERIKKQEEIEAIARQEKQRSVSSIRIENIDPVERLSTVLGSMDQELRSLKREEESLEKQAALFAKKSKEQQDLIVQLEVIRKEMDSISGSADELKEALDRLTVGAGYGSKTMKRLEVQRKDSQMVRISGSTCSCRVSSVPVSLPAWHTCSN